MHARKHLIPLLIALPLAAPALAEEASVEIAPQTVVPQRLMDAMGSPDAGGAAVAMTLRATLSHGGEPGEVRWTVFERSGDAVGEMVARGTGASFDAQLAPGEYAAHIELLGTSTVRPFTVTEGGGTGNERTFPLLIGAVSLLAASGGEPLAASEAVEFSIYDTGGEREAIRRGVRPGEAVVLPAGVYRAVVRYGEHNALAGADIRVKPGEVTHATLGVSGAPVRLSLVREAGATAALAAVSWRLFDDGGKPIMDSDEPSPALVLAPGAYTAEALHDGWTGVHRFEVVSGEPLDLKLPAGG